MWWRELIQAGKYSPGYYSGKLSQPSKAGRYSTPGNTENTTKIFLKRATPRHIIVRFNKIEIKERILRAAREKGQVTHKGKPIRLTADLSAETLQTRREWGPIFNILKEKNFQPRISYPAKLSFICEGKIKFFVNKQVLRLHHHQACFTRASERSTIHRKEQPVSAIPKSYQKVKSITIMKNLCQLIGKTAS